MLAFTVLLCISAYAFISKMVACMQPAVLRMVLICTARPICMMLALVHPLDSPERGSLVAFIFSMDPSDPPACMCSVRRSAVGAMPPMAGRAPWCIDAAGWAIH
jgi:hypothetical protein